MLWLCLILLLEVKCSMISIKDYILKLKSQQGFINSCPRSLGEINGSDRLCCMKWRSWGWTAQTHSTRTGLQPAVWHCEESSLLFLGQTVLTWRHPWWCLRLSNGAFFPSSGDLDDNTKLHRKMMSWTLMFYWLRSFSVYNEESKTVSP